MNTILNISSYIPHGYCISWNTTLIRILTMSDFVIASSYFFIATMLVYFLYKMPIIGFRKVVIFSTLFIYACGLTHVMDVLLIYTPQYPIQAFTKAITAVISLTAAIIIAQAIPTLISCKFCPNPSEELEEEKIRHSQTIKNLEMLQNQIEGVVLTRTKELNLMALPFSSYCGIAISDSKGNLIRVNRSFERITGYKQEDVVGGNPRVLKSGKHPDEFYANMWEQIRTVGVFRGEIYNKKKDGTIYKEFLTISEITNEIGETTNYIAIFIDLDQNGN